MFQIFDILFEMPGDNNVMTPEMLAQVKALMVLNQEKQKEELKDYVEMSRRASIEIRKSKFKEPQDKRAVGFISDLSYEVEDFETRFKVLLADNEKDIRDIDEIKEEAKEFLKYCVSFGHRLNKKLEREYESYKVANNSSGRWKTEKFYAQGAIFDDSLKDNGTSWLEKDEKESAEDRLKRFRNAERQAKFASKERTKFTKNFYQRGGRRKTRWDGAASSGSPMPSSSAGSSSYSYKFGPQQMYQPPQSNPVQCFLCNEFGHYRKQCPKNRKH